MATLNGRPFSLQGYSFSEIGKRLFEQSPTKDGKGLTLELTEQEERVFERNFGMKIGYSIVEVIADAAKEAGCSDEERLSYKYANRVFTT